MGFFDFFKGGKSTPQPVSKTVDTPPAESIEQPAATVLVSNSPSEYFQEAKELANSLFKFPYQSPSDVPLSVRKDKELMEIISATYQTTRAPDGTTQQTTIDAAERIRLQAEFKKRIYPLLEKCLSAETDYAPAFLLYPRVAEYNTRAKDRKELIALFERFLPQVESVVEGSRAHELIKKDNAGKFGNCFEMVERYLADYHYALARLYIKEGQNKSARAEYQKSCKLCPKIYGRGKDKIKLV